MRADNHLSVEDFYHRAEHDLHLAWPAPRTPGPLPIESPRDGRAAPIVGYLNFIRPAPVQILGAAELRYLCEADAAVLDHGLRRARTAGTAVMIVCDALPPPPDLAQRLHVADIALLTTPLTATAVLTQLRHMLSDALSQRINVHGVFMDVLGIGVLITGKSGVGKSELALELISRGHRLVADDAPEFILTAPDEVRGSCPREIQDFLEVRGLGILNVRAMFGDNAIRHRKKVDLMINLVDPHKSGLPHSDRLAGSRRTRDLMGVDIPEITLPVAIGHNLAVLVETACRDHLLRRRGFAADREFVRRHDAMLQGAGDSGTER